MRLATGRPPDAEARPHSNRPPPPPPAPPPPPPPSFPPPRSQWPGRPGTARVGTRRGTRSGSHILGNAVRILDEQVFVTVRVRAAVAASSVRQGRRSSRRGLVTACHSRHTPPESVTGERAVNGPVAAQPASQLLCCVDVGLFSSLVWCFILL